jgi:hypothetical protein
MTYEELKQLILGALQQDLEQGEEAKTTVAGREFAQGYPQLFRALTQLSEIEALDEKEDSA